MKMQAVWAILLCVACSPAAPPAQPPAQPTAAPPDAGAQAPAAGSPDALADAANTVAPALPEAPKEDSSPELPFEDVPPGKDVVWFNAYPGYTKTSKIHVRVVQDGEFVLRQTTALDAPEVGKISYKDGDTVRWRASRVVVEQPREFLAAQDITLTPMNEADPTTMQEGAAAPDLKLKRGDKVWLYFQGDVGRCYISLPRGPILLGPCLDQPQFTNPSKPDNYIMSPMEPERARWWLLVQREGKVGWMLMDSSYFAHDPKY
jgi:hypothetical protein